MEVGVFFYWEGRLEDRMINLGTWDQSMLC